VIAFLVSIAVLSVAAAAIYTYCIRRSRP